MYKYEYTLYSICKLFPGSEYKFIYYIIMNIVHYNFIINVYIHYT